MVHLLAPWHRLESYMADGGPVMVPLAVVSLVMWVLIIDRAIFFRRLQRRNMTARAAWEHIRAGRTPDPAAFQGVVALLVADFLQQRAGRADLDRAILDETIQRLQRRLEGHLAVIGVLAAMAPLLGLLGTVTGMIATFDVLSFFGTGNAKAMAGGISEALITTQTGLLVAIPGFYLKGFLDRRARTLAQRLTRVGYFIKIRLKAEGI